MTNIETENLLRTPRLYCAKIVHVHNATMVDVEVLTDFDLKFSSRCYLSGVPRVERPDELIQRAKKCTIMLIGGKKVVVETVREGTRLSNLFPILIYRGGALSQAQRFANTAIDGVPFVNINDCLNWLSQMARPFDPDVVHGLRECWAD